VDIKITSSDGVTVVKIHGRIVEGEPAEELQRALRSLVRDKKANTILDVSEVGWLDSTGIGLLVSHYVSVTKLGGKVLILKANDKIKTLMRLVHLDDRFGWTEDMNEALAWFDAS
jgi:anti-sigma B factor antagonist